MYSPDLIDALLKSADIVSVISSYIPVSQKGRSFVALCPFHDDKHPSLNISREKQIFKCFSCGAGGNAITFIEKYDKISFEEAVRKLADLVGFHDERLEKEAYKPHIDSNLVPLYNTINDLQKYYRYGLTIEEGKVAADYLSARNIDSEEIEKYGLGYAPLDGKKTVQYLEAKNHSLKCIEDIGIALARASGTSDSNAGRLIFPLSDPDGQVVGFSARRLKDDDTSKYVNSPETPIFQKGKILYNYHNAKRTAHHDGYVYLLEGFMDVMALGKAGITSALALMGTNLTTDQITLLRRLNCEVRLCLDGDEAGQTGMMRCLNLLNKAAIPFRLVYNPGDLRDPDDILQENGPAELKEKMNNLVDAFDFQIGYYTNVKALSTQEDKKKALLYFLPFVRNVEPGIDRDNYLAKLSKATGYEIEAIRRQLGRNEEEGLSKDEIISGDQVDYEMTHPDQKYAKRLFVAEREALYYMLNSMEAVSYFEKNIDSFYNSVYNEIANYITDYVGSRGKAVDVSSLIGDIGSKGADDADSLEAKVGEIASDNYHPPYSDESMSDCAVQIRKEKEKLHDERTTKEKMSGKSDEEKAAIIKEYSERQRVRLGLVNKKT